MTYVEGVTHVGGSRRGSCVAVSAPHVMSTVCHSFGPQGAPHKLQAHVISIAAE